MRTILATLLLSAVAFADATGRYAGTFLRTGADGQAVESTVVVILKQSGDTITGSGGPDDTVQYPIRNGKIAGNKITGEAVDPEGPVHKFEFRLAGDQLSGSVNTVLPDGRVDKGTLTAKKAN